MTKGEKITKLNELWYNVIGPEYHKDRDCHFYLTYRYSYGNKAEYVVEHNGYINHDYGDHGQTVWETFEDAQDELIRLLYHMIVEEANCCIHNDDVHPNRNDFYFEDVLNKANEIYMENNPIVSKECSKCEKFVDVLYDGKCDECYDEEYSGCYGGGCIGGEK